MRIGKNEAIIVLEQANYSLVSSTLTIPDGGKSWLIIEYLGQTLQQISGGEIGSFLLLTCKPEGSTFYVERGVGIWWENYSAEMGLVSGNTLAIAPKQSILLQKTTDGTWVMVTVTSGAVGDIGIQGSQGVQGGGGFQGDPGDVGIAGFQGPVGPQGTQGLFGSQGNIGGDGAQGSQGNSGVQGSQGDAGDTGSIGNAGDVGPQGSQGATGNIGPAGTPGTPC